MEEILKKLSNWREDEHEILDELAHEVATAKTMDKMVKAKNAYEIQETKIQTIMEAIHLVQTTKK